METIFTHNPTLEELKEIGCSYFPKDQYEQRFNAECFWYDLALLFRVRGDKENEVRAWSHIPMRRDEYLRGFDYFEIED